MSRIFITGDCHAAYEKLSFRAFPEGRALAKDDYMIICGDFGFWDQSDRQKYWMDWLEERPFTTLWVDGNHENFDLLEQLPVCEWHGGKVHSIRPSVIHLMRGQMFLIGGRRFFTFGGARSKDIRDGILEADDPDLTEKMIELDERGGMYRINHRSWWEQEMPSRNEMEEGIRMLERAGWETDCVITHCCSTDLLLQITGEAFERDALTDYFDIIRSQCSFSHWFFGHYHVNEDWSEKETCLYERIVELTEDGYKMCSQAKQYRYGERVKFRVKGFNGIEEHTGRIVHINEMGSGLYTGIQPTANIRTDSGRYHKDIPFEDILGS